MGTKIELSITKQAKPQHPGKPWKLDIPASVTQHRRKRLFFRTKIEAESAADDFLKSVIISGGKKAATQGETVNSALKEYMAFAKAKASDRQKTSLVTAEKRISAAFGSIPIAALDVRMIESWLNRQSWGARTKYNALGYFRTFLNWAVRRRIIESNPAQALSSDYRKPEAPKAILSVIEMRAALRFSRKDPIIRNFLVLGGFAGLRTAEIFRLRWEAFDWEEREIHVGRGVIKKTRGVFERYTRMTPALLAHLLPERAGEVQPITLNNFRRRLKKLIAKMRRSAKWLKFPDAERWADWPDNCLRHSFASYLLAKKEDAGYVAHQMGHTSPAMVHQSYARAVKRKEAEKWWAIRDSWQPSNVIDMPGLISETAEREGAVHA